MLLTTHYLEEAQSLANAVTILDQGRVAREGTMKEVLASIPAAIDFTVSTAPEAVDDLGARLTGHCQTQRDAEQTRVAIRIRDLQVDVGNVIDWARERDLRLDGFRSSPASLEDVFLDVADEDQTRSSQDDEHAA